ncbi:MAG: outer membrane protein OmpW [Enterobacteriaceae bacterium]
MKKLSLACLIAAVMAPSFASAHKAGDFIVRGGTATVRPNESSDKVLGGELTVNNNTQLGLTFGYMVTDNFGVELLAATPFNHKIGLSSAEGIGSIATVKQLPPTLMAQWYFDTPNKSLFPYLGVGVNYTNFFDASFNNNVKNDPELKLHDLELDDSWGVAVQAGLDYKLTDDWLINASVWWIDIDSTAKFKDGAGNRYSIDTRIDPVVFMFGVGYTF